MRFGRFGGVAKFLEALLGFVECCVDSSPVNAVHYNWPTFSRIKQVIEANYWHVIEICHHFSKLCCKAC